MIEQLTLRNFQCHEKLTLKFGNITTITGPSDAGKSVIVRALRWVLLNKPTGTGIVKRGQTRCMATVTVDNRKIRKSRKGAKTAYKLDDLEYKAFGNSVPDPIAFVAAIGEDSIQKQHDAPFWLSLSSGELSRTLNEVVDLSAIDSTIQTLNKWLRRSVVELEVAESRLVELREQKKNLTFVKDIDADWKVVENLSAKIDDRIRLAGRVEQLAAVGIATQRLLKTARISCDELNASLLEAAGPAQRIGRGRKLIRRVQRVVAAYQAEEASLSTSKQALVKVEAQLSKFKNCPLCGGELS